MWQVLSKEAGFGRANPRTLQMLMKLVCRTTHCLYPATCQALLRPRVKFFHSVWCSVAVNYHRVLCSDIKCVQIVYVDSCRQWLQAFPVTVKWSQILPCLGPATRTLGSGTWFRLCDLTYHCLSGTAPSYLAKSIRQLADMQDCRHIC